MPKRLVLCCDGTWNTPDQRCPTNVTKVALQVAAKDVAGREQRVFYHRGVGTNRWERFHGGVFGFGLSRSIRDIYRFLVTNFEPGDELFFFGYSRGAFTARSVVGFVRNCGILRSEHADQIDEAYALYRSRSSRTRPRSVEAQLFRRSYSYETRIRFLGVWDTVGALGIPFSGLPLANLINYRSRFHDVELSKIVDAAFHALAIDEQRGPFKPTLWKPRVRAAGQRLEQVWFAGVHSDVGGGSRDAALSDIALLWMVDRARGAGLVFRTDAFTPLPAEAVAAAAAGDATAAETVAALRNSGRCVAPNPLGRVHQSRTKLFRLLPRLRRRIGDTDPGHEYVASSALERYRRMPEYAPPGLEAWSPRNQVMQV